MDEPRDPTRPKPPDLFTEKLRARVVPDDLVDPESRIEKLMQLVGNPGLCTGCGQAVVWVKTRAGRSTPMNPDGVTHWATCPKGDSFRKTGPRDLPTLTNGASISPPKMTREPPV